MNERGLSASYERISIHDGAEDTCMYGGDGGSAVRVNVTGLAEVVRQGSLVGNDLLSRMLELRPALSGASRGRVCAVHCQGPVKKY